MYINIEELDWRWWMYDWVGVWCIPTNRRVSRLGSFVRVGWKRGNGVWVMKVEGRRTHTGVWCFKLRMGAMGGLTMERGEIARWFRRDGFQYGQL